MKNKMLLSAVCLALSAPAYAEPGLYVGASIGQASIDATRGAFTTDLDDTATVGAVFVGNRINDSFAVEAGFGTLGNYSADYDFGGGLTEHDSFKTHQISAWAVGLLPMGTVELYGKAGLVVSLMDADAVVTDANGVSGLCGPGVPCIITSSGNGNSTNMGLGLGAQFNATDRLAVRAGWTRYLNVGDGVEIAPGVELDGEDIDVIDVGATYRF
jgi:OmpA-OmpF porin, OOP family